MISFGRERGSSFLRSGQFPVPRGVGVPAEATTGSHSARPQDSGQTRSVPRLRGEWCRGKTTERDPGFFKKTLLETRRCSADRGPDFHKAAPPGPLFRSGSKGNIGSYSVRVPRAISDFFRGSSPIATGFPGATGGPRPVSACRDEPVRGEDDPWHSSAAAAHSRLFHARVVIERENRREFQNKF